MLNNTGRDDLRIIKTVKVLNTAMFSLLQRHNFGKITVRDICDEAQISRATFYSHFADKYDFLKKWLINIKHDFIDENADSEQKKNILNELLYKNKMIIKNLLNDTDSETTGIVAEIVLSFLFETDEIKSIKSTTKDVVLSSFFSGGMLHYLLWQSQNKFPSDVALINEHLYEIIKIFKKLKSQPE